MLFCVHFELNKKLLRFVKLENFSMRIILTLLCHFMKLREGILLIYIQCFFIPICMLIKKQRKYIRLEWNGLIWSDCQYYSLCLGGAYYYDFCSLMGLYPFHLKYLITFQSFLLIWKLFWHITSILFHKQTFVRGMSTTCNEAISKLLLSTERIHRRQNYNLFFYEWEELYVHHLITLVWVTVIKFVLFPLVIPEPIIHYLFSGFKYVKLVWHWWTNPN